LAPVEEPKKRIAPLRRMTSVLKQISLNQTSTSKKKKPDQHNLTPKKKVKPDQALLDREALNEKIKGLLLHTNFIGELT
jgi:hypothetical protein